MTQTLPQVPTSHVSYLLCWVSAMTLVITAGGSLCGLLCCWLWRHVVAVDRNGRHDEWPDTEYTVCTCITGSTILHNYIEGPIHISLRGSVNIPWKTIGANREHVVSFRLHLLYLFWFWHIKHIQMWKDYICLIVFSGSTALYVGIPFSGYYIPKNHFLFMLK